MQKIFIAQLIDIQPSQLYICAEKLIRVIGPKAPTGADHFEPVPLKQLGSQVIFSDGHTRAFALFHSGITQIRAYWDTDELDWNAYQVYVDWCIKAGIHSIADLKGRIISKKEYQELWLKRCYEKKGSNL